MKYVMLTLAAGILGCHTLATPARGEEAEDKLPDLIYRSNAVYSILEAAAAGNTEILRARIADGDNINQMDEMGYTALHLAAKGNHGACLMQLLQAGADPMLKTRDGKTVEQLTGSRKAARIIRSGMERRDKEIEICAKAETGDMEPLQQAMHRKGFNPNMLNQENNQSILMIVSKRGDSKLVKSLIKAGANANYVAPNRRSLLHHSVDTNNEDLIRTLLQGGADPMLKSGNNATALHDAVWGHKLNSIKALLPAYKDINFSPPGGHNGTPIELAINRNFPEVVRLFIEAGINLNDPKAPNPPLIHAAAANKAEIVTILLKAGADKNLKNRAGQTAKDAATGATRNLL